jgi:hypothetical protein
MKNKKKTLSSTSSTGRTQEQQKKNKVNVFISDISPSVAPTVSMEDIGGAMVELLIDESRKHHCKHSNMRNQLFYVYGDDERELQYNM